MERQRQRRQLQQQPAVQRIQQPLQGGTVYLTGPGGQMCPVQQIPVTGYVTVQPNQPDSAQTYKSCLSVCLGVSMMIMGALAITFNIVAIVSEDEVAVVGHGIWCGTLFIVTGGFGIGAKSRNRCMIVAFMVLCIISAACTACLLGLGITESTVNTYCFQQQQYYDDEYGVHYGYCSVTGILMGASLAVLAFLAAVAAIWGSAISCCAVCRCVSKADNGTTALYGHQQVLLISSSQGTQLSVQYPPAQRVVPTVQPAVSDPPGYYQPLLPRQQTCMPPAQQPMQPADGSQVNTYLSISAESLGPSALSFLDSACQYQSSPIYFSPEEF